MCLAIPMKIIKIDGNKGVVEAAGVRRKADLQMLSGLKVGDYIMLHAGFAIQKLDPQEAKKTLDIISQI